MHTDKGVTGEKLSEWIDSKKFRALIVKVDTEERERRVKQQVRYLKRS